LIDEKTKAVVVVIEKGNEDAPIEEFLSNVKLFINGAEYKDFGSFKVEVGPIGYSVAFGLARSALPGMQFPPHVAARQQDDV